MPVTTVSGNQPAAASWMSGRAAAVRAAGPVRHRWGASVVVVVEAAGGEAVMSLIMPSGTGA
jgi:hypothetical protein